MVCGLYPVLHRYESKRVRAKADVLVLPVQESTAAADTDVFVVQIIRSIKLDPQRGCASGRSCKKTAVGRSSIPMNPSRN